MIASIIGKWHWKFAKKAYADADFEEAQIVDVERALIQWLPPPQEFANLFVKKDIDEIEVSAKSK